MSVKKELKMKTLQNDGSVTKENFTLEIPNEMAKNLYGNDWQQIEKAELAFINETLRPQPSQFPPNDNDLEPEATLTKEEILKEFSANSDKKPNQEKAAQLPNIQPDTNQSEPDTHPHFGKVSIKVRSLLEFLGENRFQQKRFQSISGISFRTLTLVSLHGIDSLTIGEASRILDYDISNPGQLKLF